MVIVSFEDGVLIEHYLVDYQNKSVSSNEKQKWYREWTFNVVVFPIFIVGLSLFGHDMHDSDGNKHSTTEGIGHAQDLWAFSELLKKNRDHSQC